jgi:hypothetical protein
VKKFVLIALLMAMFALLAFGQSDAGFLDSDTYVSNPGSWSGAAWYCKETITVYDEQEQMFVPSHYILAGPFSTRPNCNEY